MMAFSRPLHKLMSVQTCWQMQHCALHCRTYCIMQNRHRNSQLRLSYAKPTFAETVHTSAVLTNPRGLDTQSWMRKQTRKISPANDHRDVVENESGDFLDIGIDPGFKDTYIVGRESKQASTAEVLDFVQRDFSCGLDRQQKEMKQSCKETALQDVTLKYANPLGPNNNQKNRTATERRHIQKGQRLENGTSKRNSSWKSEGWFQHGHKGNMVKDSTSEMRITSPTVSAAFPSSGTNSSSESGQIRRSENKRHDLEEAILSENRKNDFEENDISEKGWHGLEEISRSENGNHDIKEIRRSEKRKQDLKHRNQWKRTGLNDGLHTTDNEHGKGHWKAGNKNRNNVIKRKLRYVPAEDNDILFGIAPCQLALQQKRRIVHSVFITPSFKRSERSEVHNILAAVGSLVEVKVVHRSELDRLCGDRPHQGICIETSPLEYYTLSDREEVLKAQLQCLQRDINDQHPPVWIALDQIKDPMNFGAVLRSSYFLGVDRVISCVQNSCPLSPVVSKASSGVMEVLEVYAAMDMAIFLQFMVASGWQVVGTTSSTTAECQHGMDCVPFQEFTLTQPTVLVVGNEGSGMRAEVADKCSTFLTIQPGRQLHLGIDSLNVSVATGILLQSLLNRQ